MYGYENPAIDRQLAMAEMLHLELIIAEAKYGYPGKAAKIEQEFQNMLLAATTVTGVEDMAEAVHAYVECHYDHSLPKPTWYENLTPGDRVRA